MNNHIKVRNNSGVFFTNKGTQGTSPTNKTVSPPLAKNDLLLESGLRKLIDNISKYDPSVKLDVFNRHSGTIIEVLYDILELKSGSYNKESLIDLDLILKNIHKVRNGLLASGKMNHTEIAILVRGIQNYENSLNSLYFPISPAPDQNDNNSKPDMEMAHVYSYDYKNKLNFNNICDDLKKHILGYVSLNGSIRFKEINKNFNQIFDNWEYPDIKNLQTRLKDKGYDLDYADVENYVKCMLKYGRCNEHTLYNHISTVKNLDLGVFMLAVKQLAEWDKHLQKLPWYDYMVFVRNADHTFNGLKFDFNSFIINKKRITRYNLNILAKALLSKNIVGYIDKLQVTQNTLNKGSLFNQLINKVVNRTYESILCDLAKVNNGSHLIFLEALHRIQQRQVAAAVYAFGRLILRGNTPEYAEGQIKKEFVEYQTDNEKLFKIIASYCEETIIKRESHKKYASFSHDHLAINFVLCNLSVADIDRLGYYLSLLLCDLTMARIKVNIDDLEKYRAEFNDPFVYCYARVMAVIYVMALDDYNVSLFLDEMPKEFHVPLKVFFNDNAKVAALGWENIIKQALKYKDATDKVKETTACIMLFKRLFNYDIALLYYAMVHKDIRTDDQIHTNKHVLISMLQDRLL